MLGIHCGEWKVTPAKKADRQDITASKDEGHKIHQDKGTKLGAIGVRSTEYHCIHVGSIAWAMSEDWGDTFTITITILLVTYIVTAAELHHSIQYYQLSFCPLTTCCYYTATMKKHLRAFALLPSAAVGLGVYDRPLPVCNSYPSAHDLCYESEMTASPNIDKIIPCRIETE